MFFSDSDLKQLNEKGITPEQVSNQIKNFENGFVCTKLVAPATAGNGITVLGEKELEEMISLYEKECVSQKIIKFVPASGAATRMFKEQFEWVDELKSGVPATELIKNDNNALMFIENIRQFGFWPDLYNLLQAKGIDADQCLAGNQLLTILNNLLEEDGLGYAHLPKGLLKFHNYNTASRTAAEEHLIDGTCLVGGSNKTAKVHFTVSQEHKDKFAGHIGKVLDYYTRLTGVTIEVEFSVQKPSTDTLAVCTDNTPFREKDGSLLFRPAGHGALVHNLNELTEDIVFINNIDNIVPDRLRTETLKYKKALGGLLIKVKQEIHSVLHNIDNIGFDHLQLDKTKSLLHELNILDFDKIPSSNTEAKELIRTALNRPIRVCGMVKNTGEPGGGPFWVNNPGTSSDSLQIVESSQVDMGNPEQRTIFNRATHFNPVDLVCAIKNYKGESFDLTRFVDYTSGFISLKSKNGKELKAQELPGLWNGAMAYWITMFVEVPVETFNPVKTVMDLLRPQHLN